MQGAILIGERRRPDSHDGDCSKRALHAPGLRWNPFLATANSSSRRRANRRRPIAKPGAMLQARRIRAAQDSYWLDPVLQHPHLRSVRIQTVERQGADARFRPLPAWNQITL